MKNLTWDEFIRKERFTPSVGDEIRIVEKANEIVTLMKSLDYMIYQLRLPDNIDFMGCSSNYVIEKIKMAISSLNWIKTRIKEIEKKK